jgi:hypothetical protein
MTAPARPRRGHQQEEVTETLGGLNSAAARSTEQDDAAMPRTCREAMAPERAALKALVDAPPECRRMLLQPYIVCRSRREQLVRDLIRGRP